MKGAVEIVSDCCGIHARTMLLDGGKWYIWEETKHYKTEISAAHAITAATKEETEIVIAGKESPLRLDYLKAFFTGKVGK